MAPRTYPKMERHLAGVVQVLEDAGFEFPIGALHRPLGNDEKFVAPPLAVVRISPSTGQFDGPLSDSQVDVVVRIQIIGVGITHEQALNVLDRIRPYMQRRLIIIEDRRVMDVRLMVSTGGAARDRDTATPFFEAQDIYELQTTPT